MSILMVTMLYQATWPMSTFFLEIVKIEFKNDNHGLFFLKDAMMAPKKNSLYHSPHKSKLNDQSLSYRYRSIL
jgi:hypothetical protein